MNDRFSHDPEHQDDQSHVPDQMPEIGDYVECTVDHFYGRFACCLMDVGAREGIPIDFPVGVMNENRLAVGDRFLWKMPDSGEVRGADIQPLPPKVTEDPAERSKRINVLLEEERKVDYSDVEKALSRQNNTTTIE